MNCIVENCKSIISPKSKLKLCQYHLKLRSKRMARNLPYDNKSLSSKLPKGTGISEYPNHYQMKQNRKIKLKNCNYKCEICNQEGKYAHHKDFSKDNHEISNLMVICYKCHLQLHKLYK